MIRDYVHQGLSVNRCIEISGLTRHQYYYRSTGKAKGRKPSQVTLFKESHSGMIQEVDNSEVVSRIVEIKLDPDHANYYRLITMTLCLQGYYINHKKVYRLMYEYLLLEDKASRSSKRYVQHRRAVPRRALEILEMDIKYVWIVGKSRYAFVLTIIDTFTRYVLHWSAGYSMKSGQVQDVWEYVIAHYIQPYRGKDHQIEIEVRSDNGSQFSSKQIIDFFKENELTQLHTHPYTPEENGHIESFHKTLSKAISKDRFESLSALEKRLSTFYTAYNNKRAHGSILGLPPAIYWSLQSNGYIEIIIDEEKRKVKSKLKVAYQDIMELPNIWQYRYRVLRA